MNESLRSRGWRCFVPQMSKLAGCLTLRALWTALAVAVSPGAADLAAEPLFVAAATVLQDAGTTALTPQARAPIPSPRLEDLEAVVQQQLLGARREFDEALASAASNEAALALAHGRLGQSYHAYDFRGPALACYERAMAYAPNDSRWPRLAADVAHRQGDSRRAETLYRSALALIPGDVPTAVHLGEILVERGRLDEADTLFTMALELDPHCLRARAKWGEIALSRGHYGLAVERLEAVLMALPEANRLHYSLAMAYRGLGDQGRARSHLEKLGTVGVRLDDPLLQAVAALASGERLWLLKGRQAFGAGHYEQAVEAFRQALAADPQSVRSRVNLASALGAAGDPLEAIEQYRRVLAVSPDQLTAHFNLGVLLARDQRDDEAEPHLVRVCQSTPDDGAAQRELAQLLHRSGRWQEALSHYGEAVRLDPSDGVARLGEGQLLVGAQRYAEALERLEQGHRMLPQDGQLATALAKLLAASPRAELRDGLRAYELAARVFRATGQWNHGELVALALAELGRCDEAAQWLRKAAELSVDASVKSRLQRAAAVYEAGPPCAAPVADTADR